MELLSSHTQFRSCLNALTKQLYLACGSFFEILLRAFNPSSHALVFPLPYSNLEPLKLISAHKYSLSPSLIYFYFLNFFIYLSVYLIIYSFIYLFIYFLFIRLLIFRFIDKKICYKNLNSGNGNIFVLKKIPNPNLSISGIT